MGRTFFRVVAVVALLAVLAVVGIGIYDAGVSAGLTEAARQAAASGQPAPATGYPGPYYVGPHLGWGFGFGFFGIFFWILGILLIIGLIRAAFGWGRWGGPGRWSGPGAWGGPGHWGGPGSGGGPQTYLEDWHRRAHTEGPQEPPDPSVRA
jgi:hypothetical protein